MLLAPALWLLDSTHKLANRSMKAASQVQAMGGQVVAIPGELLAWEEQHGETQRMRQASSHRLCQKTRNIRNIGNAWLGEFGRLLNRDFVAFCPLRTTKFIVNYVFVYLLS